MQRRRRLLEIGLAVAVPLVCVLAWQVASETGAINSLVYPAPSTIVSAIWDLIESGRLADDARATTLRVFFGFVIGAGLGFALGIGMGASRWLRVGLEPTLNALYVVPKLALLPIFLTIFGLGDGAKTAVVAVTVFFFIWIGAMEAVANVPAGYRDAARSFGVSRWQMFRHVLLPGALPQFFVAMRVAVGVAILVVIAAEFVVGRDGLGQLIFTSRTLFINSWMYAGIVCVALEGVLLAAVITWVGRRVTPWDVGSSSRSRTRA